MDVLGNDGVSILIYGESGIGKALANGAGVLTPQGFVPIETLNVGDDVIDPDGGTAKVEGVYPQGVKQTYRLTARDGGSVACTADHLWTVQTPNDRARGGERTIVTELMLGNLRGPEDSNGWSRHNFFLPIMQAAQFDMDEKGQPIHPYLLGVLLGAGASNKLLVYLRELGLHHHMSPEKFIPPQYMQAPFVQRRQLLEGLMDTDGDCTKEGVCIFNTSSERLAWDVMDLVRGLGGIASLTVKENPKFTYRGETRTGRTAYRVNVRLPYSPFRLERKAKRWTEPTMARAITSLEPEGEVECTCIRVSSKRGLFVTDGYIVTHNSTDVGYALRKAAWLQTEPGGLIPVIRCVGYTPEIIHTLFDSENPDKEFKEVLETKIIPGINQGKIGSVVLDTGSELAARMEGAFGKRFKDGRQVYQEIVSTFVGVVDRIIKMGIWFVMICHELPPETDNSGRSLRGGPLMPGKKLPRRLPPKFDLVLRATVETSVGEDDGRRIYECNPLSTSYVMKDRFGVMQKTQPMELAPVIYKIMNPGKEVPEQLLEKRLKLAQ